MGIETENQNIENSMRYIAKDLLSNKEVDVVIGYSKGTMPLSSAPIIIDKAEDVEKLIWNNLCYINLAKYLVPMIPNLIDPEKGNLKVGIVSKGCVGRAILHLAVEKQINLDNVKIIGIPCNGIVNRKKIEREIGEREVLEVSVSDDNIIVKGKGFEEKFSYDEYINELCKKCKIKSPPTTADLAEICLGSCVEVESVYDEFEDVVEFEGKTADEKWEYIKDVLSTCTRCYACREACPMCYCNLCFVDQNKPIWFGKTTEINDIIIFHLVRALHMAGRCVACGACSSVCPMGIDLNFITRKLEKIAKDRFKFTTGLNPTDLAPMMNFEMEDDQEFMVEEE